MAAAVHCCFVILRADSIVVFINKVYIISGFENKIKFQKTYKNSYNPLTFKKKAINDGKKIS